jgi:hypothetical protein
MPLPGRFNPGKRTKVHTVLQTGWALGPLCTCISVKVTHDLSVQAQKRNGSVLEAKTQYGTEGCGWTAPRSGRFVPMKEFRYTFYRRIGGLHGRSCSTGVRTQNLPACSELLRRLRNPCPEYDTALQKITLDTHVTSGPSDKPFYLRTWRSDSSIGWSMRLMSLQQAERSWVRLPLG